MGRLGPEMVVVFPGESVSEPELEPGLLHLVSSPAPPPRCLGWELLEIPKSFICTLSFQHFKH